MYNANTTKPPLTTNTPKVEIWFVPNFNFCGSLYLEKMAVTDRQTDRKTDRQAPVVPLVPFEVRSPKHEFGRIVVFRSEWNSGFSLHDS